MALSNYLYCGMTLASNISFPELSQSDVVNRALVFTLRDAKKKLANYAWDHEWYSARGESILSYRWQGSYHWLHFPGQADFRISSKVKEVSCYPLPEIPQQTVRHLLLDQVLPRCLAYQGKIMLHASAVVLEKGLIIFIGDSGAGKSTLAGDFHQAGQLAVSDDCLWVKESEDQIVAVPSYSGLRLWQDSLATLFAVAQRTDSMAHYSAKKRVLFADDDAHKFASGLPIRAVVVLSAAGQTKGSQIMMDRLSWREAFIALMKQSFQMNALNREEIERYTIALARMVPRLATFRLCMPHNYDLLPFARQKILETIA